MLALILPSLTVPLAAVWFFVIAGLFSLFFLFPCLLGPVVFLINFVTASNTVISWRPFPDAHFLTPISWHSSFHNAHSDFLTAMF